MNNLRFNEWSRLIKNNNVNMYIISTHKSWPYLIFVPLRMICKTLLCSFGVVWALTNLVLLLDKNQLKNNLDLKNITHLLFYFIFWPSTHSLLYKVKYKKEHVSNLTIDIVNLTIIGNGETGVSFVGKYGKLF